MKKRILSLFLVFTILSTLLPQFLGRVSATTHSGSCGENLSWAFDAEAGVLTISGSGPMDNYTYDHRAPWATYGDSINTIHIGDGITTIGDYAFGWHSAFNSISFPHSLTAIGEYAFFACGALKNLIIDGSVKTIGDSAFRSCWGLESVLTGESVESIGAMSFAYCTSLSDLKIGNNTKIIHQEAFWDCIELKKIVIPKQVQDIGYSAFYYNSSMDPEREVWILNPACRIGLNCCEVSHDGSAFLPWEGADFGCNVTFYGYENSSTQEYAEFAKEYNGSYFECSFISLGKSRPWESTSIYEQPSQALTLTIYENRKRNNQLTEDYRLADTANVEYKGTVYSLNASDNGRITIPYSGGSITVTKDKYLSRTISEEALKESQSIYLQKQSDISPVINGLWVDHLDILREAYRIPLTGSGISTVTPEIDWGKSSCGSITLLQGINRIPLSEGPNSINWSERLDISEDVYLVATNAEGESSRRKLQIAVEGSLPNGLDGLSLSWGDKITLTLPESVPFFGGEKISAGLPTFVPVECIVEDEKVYVAIGYRNSSEDNDKNKKKETETKTFVQKVKDDYQKASKGYNTDQKMRNSLGKGLYKGKGSFAFDADFTIAGFMEGYLTSDGRVQWLEHGLLIGAGMSVGYSLPFYVGPVPLFFETSLSASVQAKLNIYIEDTLRDITPHGSISGEVKVSAGVGLGVKKVASVSGGLEGKLNPEWDFAFGKTDYFKLTASLNAYAKAEVLCFSYQKSWDPISEAIWLEYPSRKNPQTVIQETTDFDPYNISAYKPADLDYLKEPSQFFTAKKNTPTLEADSITATDFLTNAYAGADPQIVTFSDGSMLAVWLGSDGSAEMNALQIYSSYFNGSTWSQPAVVDADDTMDGDAYLTIIDDMAYLVWQDAISKVDETSTLEEIAPLMGISFASFDKASGQFSVESVTENVENLNMSPILCGTKDILYIVWLNNSENAWFGDNTANSILCRCLSNGTWSEIEALYSGLQSVDSLTANYTEGMLNIAYCADTDGDIATETDVEAYLNGTIISENDHLDSSTTYSAGMLYRFQNDALIDENGNTIIQMETDRFQIIDDRGVKAVLYNQYRGLYSTIYAVFYDASSKTWGEPLPLTAMDGSYKSFCASVDVNGKLYILANRVEVASDYSSENPYGEATLQLITIPLQCDLMITESYYDCSNYVAGADMTFDICVKNNGEITANGLLVQIKDATGTLLNESLFADPLLPGATVEITCGYTPTTVEPGKELIISVMPFKGTDRNDADNQAEAVLNFEDITVENIGWGINSADETVVFANIVNRSYTPRSTPITVHLREDTVDSANIRTLTIDTMESMESLSASFSLPYEEGKVYYIVAETETGNSNISNDSDFVVVMPKLCSHSFSYVGNGNGTHTMSCSICEHSEISNCVFENGQCICGQTEIKEPIVETKWKIGHTLNLASDISVSLAISKTSLDGFDPDTIYVLAELDTYEGNTKTGIKTIEIRPIEKSGYYYFTLNGLTAVNMNDQIRSVLYGTKDGQVYFSPIDEYSIATYAYGQMENASRPQKLKNLCAELLRYGAKAQIFKSYRLDALADAKMTEEQKSFLSDMNSVVFNSTNTVLNDLENAPMKWEGKALDLASKITLRYIFSPGNYAGDLKSLALHLTFLGVDGQAKTMVLTGAELYNAEHELYAFTFDGLLAAELRTVVSAQIYEGSTPVSCTLQYSADTYGNNKTGTLSDLCKALFAYSDSAKNFFS